MQRRGSNPDRNGMEGTAVAIRNRSPEAAHGARLRPITTLNCLSIDVEEYFQCEVFARCVRPADWPGFERRCRPRLERIGTLLAEHRRQATFFVLGAVVDELKTVLRDLAAAGHEIACHGHGHQHLGRVSPAELRDDLRRSRDRIVDAVGVVPQGYRAPTFSVTRPTAWALDEIIDAGFAYDASIFPVHHDRYGVPNAPAGPFWAIAPSGRRLLEFPPLTARLGRLRVPVGGGGYLRLLPSAVVRHCVARAVRRDEPVMLYLHPWELDPDQPRLPIGRLATWRHRVNLHTTEQKLGRLLSEFDFAPASVILESLCTGTPLPSFRVGD